jgi:hypothetical protein
LKGGGASQSLSSRVDRISQSDGEHTDSLSRRLPIAALEEIGTTGAMARHRVGAWLTTMDHKRIGVLYGTSPFTFFLLGGLKAVLMRGQLARPDNTLVGAETYAELFTMHGTTMIFLAVS